MLGAPQGDALDTCMGAHALHKLGVFSRVPCLLASEYREPERKQSDAEIPLQYIYECSLWDEIILCNMKVRKHV